MTWHARRGGPGGTLRMVGAVHAVFGLTHRLGSTDLNMRAGRTSWRAR